MSESIKLLKKKQEFWSKFDQNRLGLKIYFIFHITLSMGAAILNIKYFEYLITCLDFKTQIKVVYGQEYSAYVK